MDMNGLRGTLQQLTSKHYVSLRSERQLEPLQTDPAARHGAWYRDGPATPDERLTGHRSKAMETLAGA